MAAIKDYGVGFEEHFPNSRKVYKAGSTAGIRVPFGEVALSPSRRAHGNVEANGCAWM